MNFSLNILGNTSVLKEKREQTRMLHVYLEERSIEYALVKYAEQSAFVELTFSTEHSGSKDLGGHGLEESITQMIGHMASSLGSDTSEENTIRIDHITVSLSPAFIESESADVVRISESPKVLTSFETDLDISDTIIHREIRDVSLNGYKVSPADALGLTSETVTFKEEVHTLERSFTKMIKDVFEKNIPGSTLSITSSLAESIYVIERLLSPQDDWQLLHIDHADTYLYKRDGSTTTALGYGFDELIEQLVVGGVGHDELAVLTSLRMAVRGDLARDISEKASYTLDIESSVIVDALTDAGYNTKSALYVHTPHRVISDLIGGRLGKAYALEQEYRNTAHHSEYVHIPAHLRVSMHLLAAIEYHMINQDSSL